MKKKRLVAHVVDVMTESGADQIDIGELDMLADAYARFGGRIEHPLDICRAVMAAVRRSDYFEQTGTYLLAHDSIGRQARLAVFKLKKTRAE